MMSISDYVLFLTVSFRDDGAAMGAFSWYTAFKDQAVYIVQQQNNWLGSPNDLYDYHLSIILDLAFNNVKPKDRYFVLD